MTIISIKWKLNKAYNGSILGGEYMYFRCSASIMYLIDNEGLKKKNFSIKAI